MAKKLKKILLCFIFLFCACALFGCGVNLSVVQKSSGAIFVEMQVDLQDMPSNRQTVNAIVTEYFKQLNNAYEDNLVRLYSNVYDFSSIDEDTTKSSDTKFREKFDYIYTRNLGKYLISKSDNLSDECSHNKDCTLITIQKQFGSIYGFVMYFYPKAFVYDAKLNNVVISSEYKSLVDIPMGGQLTEENTAFIKKYIQTFKPFYYNGEEAKFLEDSITAGGITAGQKLSTVLSEKTGFSEDSIKKVFSFTTPYKRVHSNGSCTHTEDGYTHTWTLNKTGDSCEVWRTFANQPMWYVLAGLLGIAIFALGALVIFVINARKKAIGMKALKKINDLNQKQNEDKYKK